MNEFLSGLTSLPNIHPAVVHFPIALLPVAVILDLLLMGLEQQRGWLERAAASLYVGAALGCGAAFWAGRQAVDALPPLAPSVQLYVNQHADSALYVLWLVGVLSVARAALTIVDPKANRRVPRAALLLVALVAVGLVFRTADLGGALVYQHGVGVAATMVDGSETSEVDSAGAPLGETLAGESLAPASSRLLETGDGALEWNPLPGDRDALGSVLSPAPGTTRDAASWVAAPDGEKGLSLSVAGFALLVLPRSFGDVQVEAELDLQGFVGEAGLVHHVDSATQAGFFTVSPTSNEYVLGTLDGDNVRQLGRSTAALSPGPVRLTVSAIGRHFKGLVDDEAVVHGHEPALPDGKVGLLFRGRGSVRVLSLKVVPVGT